MSEGFLLTRVLLHLGETDEVVREDISAAAIAPDGSLWIGSDEGICLERLSRLEPCVYGNHQRFSIADFIELSNTEDEIDIEGMDYSQNYLWVTGSHSTKRGKAKGKKPEKDIRKLSKIKTDANRYLIGRIPIVGGELLKVCSNPDRQDEQLTAAGLQRSEHSNILMDLLQDDPHLGPFLSIELPSKDNGFDIEGLAVCGDKIFLGLRGPVLRGWAIILEIEVDETEPGVLGLKPLNKDGDRYRKHFVDLDGLGVRELCLRGDDLLILAGPTMELEGAMRVFCLHDATDLSESGVFNRESEQFEALFDLPFVLGGDRAEGLSLFSSLGSSQSLLVVYDSPHPKRKVPPHSVFADVFRLP